MKKLNFNIKDRKVLTLGLCLVLVCVFTLTVAYSALSAVLTINGNARVSAADWDIYLDNPRVTNGSATTDVPIVNGVTATFNTTLNMPGDYYEFVVDVVNDGSIDAMIENVVKTPDLTAEQAKFLKYEITYQNGENISTKQTLSKGTAMPIKVRIEYRNDLIASDLPTGQVVLDLSLTLEYIQSDGTGSSVNNNGVDSFAVGTEKCFGEECFYVISSDEDTVTMLAKYNLYVGEECRNLTDSTCVPYGEDATGKQDSKMVGAVASPIKGSTSFSETAYWLDTINNSSSYIYNENSTLYNYVENYKIYLGTLGVTVNEARLITKEELESLGCYAEGYYYCVSAPSWVYSTSYWTGTVSEGTYIWAIAPNRSFLDYPYSGLPGQGVRPVITISKSNF